MNYWKTFEKSFNQSRNLNSFNSAVVMGRTMQFKLDKEQHEKELQEIYDKLESMSWSFKDENPACLNTKHRTVCYSTIQLNWQLKATSKQ